MYPWKIVMFHSLCWFSKGYHWNMDLFMSYHQRILWCKIHYFDSVVLPKFAVSTSGGSKGPSTTNIHCLNLLETVLHSSAASRQLGSDGCVFPHLLTFPHLTVICGSPLSPDSLMGSENHWHFSSGSLIDRHVSWEKYAKIGKCPTARLDCDLRATRRAQD